MVAITVRKRKGYSFCVLSRIFLEGSENALFLLETFIESLLYFRHSARETKMSKITSTFLRRPHSLLEMQGSSTTMIQL